VGGRRVPSACHPRHARRSDHCGPNASLLCHGLTKLDDATLEYFAAHPSLLTRIYERSAPLFAAFANSIRIRDNRAVPAGDDAAAALWEFVLNEKTTRADRFFTALLESNDGRLAYLYDTIAQVNAPHQAFMLGTWLTDTARFERFKALAAAMSGLREWHVRVLPFGRSSYDLGMALARIAVGTDGRPAPPAARGYWHRIFTGSELKRRAALRWRVGRRDDRSRGRAAAW
jgi:hypothetical protein